MNAFVFILGLCATLLATQAEAGLRVFACEPEWAALARELAGDSGEIYSATTALQDVHHIQARPSLIAKVRRADLLVCTGAELEIGWLPVLLRRSSNPRIQPGTPGYLQMADHVPMLERPAVVDRAEGDVHPQGNPHIQLDPRNIERLAPVLSARLQKLDPDNTRLYQARLADFRARWSTAMAKWSTQARPLQGMPVVVYHAAWSYMNHWLGLRQVATIESKPGLPPSSQYLATMVDRLQRDPAKLIIYAAYQAGKPADWLSRKTGIPARALPFTVGGAPGAGDLFGLFDVTLQRLLETSQPHG